MTRVTRDGGQGRYVARLLDGPRAGSLVRVPSRSNGDPPDELAVESERQGLYLLAGLPGNRGTLPYRWLSWQERAALRRWLRGRVDRLAQPGN